MTLPRALDNPSPSDVADSVERAAAGDEQAFEALMRRHNRIMFRTARAILKDDAEAEEAVQDAYMKAYHALKDFRGAAQLSTWLARIVANEALMRLRKQTRRAEILPLQPGAGEYEMAGNSVPDTTMNAQPERSAERKEMKRLLEAQIDALPEAYRTVFMLRAVEELSVEETAEV